MNLYVIEDENYIPPFNQTASLLTIGVKPLKFHHQEIFDRLASDLKVSMVSGPTFRSRDDLSLIEGRSLVYRDNLWFDYEFIDYFIKQASQTKHASRAAIYDDDKAFSTYALPLAQSFEAGFDHQGRKIHLLDLWYFPDGYTADVIPVLVPSDAEKIGFYSVPQFMRIEQDDLDHYAPARSMLSIESWVHVYYASIIFSNFARASRFDRQTKKHNFYSLKLLWQAVLEQKHLLSTSEVVRVGKNTSIHPTAVITGPAEIGDNCTIGAGAFLDNVTIGNNVTIDDGCTLMMSTVGDDCFLPFRTALYLTSVMEHTIIAQNTCLQMCVIGRNSFVGAGNTFTDFNLVSNKPIRAANLNNELEEVGQIVLGSAVGHHCRIGSGLVVFPGRMIESDVVLVASYDRRVINRSIEFEHSDHHYIPGGTKLHPRLYPRKDELTEQHGDTW